MTSRNARILSIVTLSLACSSGPSKDDSPTQGDMNLPDDDGDGVPAGSDCNDTDPAISPDATEVCDGIDNNCDGLIDDDDPNVDLTTAPSFYPDADGDGFGDALASAVQACVAPTDAGVPMVEDGSDCNDADAAISPAAAEVCDPDNVDEDCNGVADDADSAVDLSDATTWYTDMDGDGFGDVDAAGLLACDDPSESGLSYAETATDCDDTDAAVNPAATEVCDPDNVDEDCNGVADDADTGVDPSTVSAWAPDADRDGFGSDAETPIVVCDDPSTALLAYVADTTDCDDNNAAINPDAVEVCDPDDVDEDCNGVADDADAGVDLSTVGEYYEDVDGDGYGSTTATATIACDDPSTPELPYAMDATDCDDTSADAYPGAVELCNGEDDDCDGSSDDSGLATFWSAAGVAVDYTSVLAGTASSPSLVLLSSDGSLGVCAGTWYTNLFVDADVDIYGQTGVASDVVLDGALTDAVVTSVSDGLSYSLSGLTLQNGVGSSLLFGNGSEAGGGVACYTSSVSTSITIDNVAIVDNVSPYVGGGLFTYDCDLTITDTEISGNESGFGGAGFIGGGLLTIEDSSIDENYGTLDVGGLHLYNLSGNGVTLDMVDSTMSSNESANTCGALALEGSVSATIEGTSSGAASITENAGSNTVGGAIYMSGSSSLTLDTVDMGTTSGGDDNEPLDFYLLDSAYSYRYDDGVSVSCTADRCGTAYTETVGSLSSLAAGDLSTRGNVFLADKHGTIESIEFYAAAYYGRLCDMDFYVLSAGSLSDGTWTVEAANTTAITSSSMSWVDSGTLGVAVEPGTYYALVTAYDCAAASDYLLYGYATVGASTDDMGMGTSVGRWYESSGAYTSTWSGTAPSYFSSSNTRYYSRVNWSH